MLLLFLLFTLCVAMAMVVGEAGIFDLDPKKFQEEVVSDERVWLVEFYSPMCGSCQEFAPTWHKIAQKTKTMVKGQVNIDTKEGMDLAERLGALQEGIPNLRIFAKKGDAKGKALLTGLLCCAKAIYVLRHVISVFMCWL
ncbi:hypothetical protein EON64_11585 [archaeon]|nr:MAG: hypothetical protein EON64_11585 [archaeon]